MTDGQNRQPVYYGWVLCGACTLLLFVTMGTASNALSVFMPHIMKTYSLTGAQTSSLLTLRCTFAFLFMFLVRRYYDQVGFRAGTAAAAALCGIAHLIYSAASSYPAFCVGASVAGVSYGLGSMIPAAILVDRWFVRHKALAIGICSTGSGIAIIPLPPILTAVILRYSLRTAFLATAAFAIAAAALIFLLIRERPSDLGLEPPGRAEALRTHGREESRVPADVPSAAADDEPVATPGAADVPGPAETPGQEPRTLSRGGWILMGLVSIAMGALSNPGIVHLSVLFTDEGFSPMIVAVLISITGIVLTASKILCGGAADRMGGLRASMLFLTIYGAGNVLCCLAFLRSIPLAALAVTVFATGCAITTVGIPVWAGDLVSEHHYAETVQRMQIIYAAGAMIFATMPGILADRLGSYVPVYALFASIIAASLACLAAAYRDSDRPSGDRL